IAAQKPALPVARRRGGCRWPARSFSPPSRRRSASPAWRDTRSCASGSRPTSTASGSSRRAATTPCSPTATTRRSGAPRRRRLSVAIRDAAGAARVIETPFDPSHEIYVDYAVLDGRLWIRRVFDDRTPPGEGVLVDPQLAQVDWDARGGAYGKATYRSLGPGRWVVSVSGDGSLGLVRVPDGEPTELAPPPPVRSYEPVEDARHDALREL